MARSFLKMQDISADELNKIFGIIKSRKGEIEKRKGLKVLQNKVVGLLFEKPSTRTRTSFEAATDRLGGSAIYLPSSEMQLKRGEPIKDTARILGSYLDGLVARVFGHQDVVDLAQYAGMPIINGLSDMEHPTQVVCDLYTVLEVRKKLKGLTMTYIGDGDNMCNSLYVGCAMVGMNMNAACPPGYKPDEATLEKAREIAKKTGAKLNLYDHPQEAAPGTDVFYTDVWVSMGDEAEKDARMKAFQGYQINADLLKLANAGASVMHCLPAHRGLEITDDVIEGPQSIVWQQGANKMYGAAGILEFFLG
ncbi:MAG: ornithine carbamoyltransferase [Candidatus Margulisbacteria bacterium]|nr:ornithine carbamoyltransferase [Candidatus Margulisiibacteriota bacterium]